MKRSSFKNTALATILSTTLAACGGGGGGGGVGVSFDPAPVNNINFNVGIADQLVGDFVSVVHNLSQDEILDVKDALEIFQWVDQNQDKFNSNALSGYRITVDGTEMSLEKGFNMLLGFKKRYYDGKETFWENTAKTGKLDDEDEDYLALKQTALEDIEKQKTDKDTYFNTLESTGKATVVSTTEKNTFSAPVYSETALNPVISYSDWKMVASEDGESTSTTSTVEENRSGAVYEVTTTTTVTPVIKTYNRTKTVTTPYSKTKKVTKTSTVYTTWSNGEKTIDIQKTNIETSVNRDPDVTETIEARQETVEGEPLTEIKETLVENPVVSTEIMEPTETESITEGAEYTETTSVLGDAQSSYTEQGSATTSTEYTYQDTTVDNGDGTATTTRTKFTVTTTTLPVTTYYTKVRTYTDRVYKDVTTTVTTTPRTLKTYANGDTEIVTGTPTESQSIVKTLVRTGTRSVTETVDSEVNNTVTTSTDEGTVEWVKTTTTAYTDADGNLGTRTPDYSTDKTTYETSEYNESNNGYKVYEKINVSSAYSRGWTGKGSIVAVADTGYDVDHSEFEGQVVATKDYTGTGIGDNQGHGSHVLGSIVAKKDGTGMHGVAYDAKAVVVKIGDGRSVSLDSAQTGLSWAADLGAVVGNLSANSNYDSWFRDSITSIGDGTFKTTSPYYDYGAGDYYNNMSVDGWKTITDKGMVVVNSAGNQGLDISAMPGWFATEVDADGNLVLGGKMLIVGSYNFNTNSIDGFSNRAGHLCRVIVDDACRDEYKTSDFYVLAPGWTYSASKDGGYNNLTGTSMAAPIVTGQVAILHQMWPHMTGENLVKLVTNTADKSIAGYDVNIHGQGVVDFDEATKPQGAVGIPTTGRADGAIASVEGTGGSGSASMASAISNVNIMVLDDYDRDYYLNMGNSFTVKDNRKYSDTEMLLADNHTFLPTQQMYGSFAQGGQWDLVKDYNFGFYTGQGGNGDYSTNVGKNFFISDRLKLKTSVGHMSEQETWLGNQSDGVLAVGDNNATNFGNIGVDYQIGNNVLSLDYTRGKTNINTVDDSLIKSFSDVETESYRLAYEIHKDKHNTLGWSFSLPSHITSGTMDLEVAESVNLDGTINYETIKSDLTQGTKEKNIGFYFNHEPTDTFDAGIKFTTEYRQDIAGQSGKDGMNFTLQFAKKLKTACKFLWMKNPKCYETDPETGKEVMKANLFGAPVDNATAHGLRYDLKTDKFIPINPEDKKWKQ
jgi:subtilisin family serine protease